ncbi:hypothetical protein CEXT_293691 [Caerostris extrusa]|uniref:Uncharacterized protein n=1 Tax=Caerostris extrusa TaxID=172846 RepID=A0AAV4UUD1_CAEEX|nr:hypothetical protein CEXT_293691 [Caerostris extrusa]
MFYTFSVSSAECLRLCPSDKYAHNGANEPPLSSTQGFPLAKGLEIVPERESNKACLERNRTTFWLKDSLVYLRVVNNPHDLHNPHLHKPIQPHQGIKYSKTHKTRPIPNAHAFFLVKHCEDHPFTTLFIVLLNSIHPLWTTTMFYTVPISSAECLRLCPSDKYAHNGANEPTQGLPLAKGPTDEIHYIHKINQVCLQQCFLTAEHGYFNYSHLLPKPLAKEEATLIQGRKRCKLFKSAFFTTRRFSLRFLRVWKSKKKKKKKKEEPDPTEMQVNPRTGISFKVGRQRTYPDGPFPALFNYPGLPF